MCCPLQALRNAFDYVKPTNKDRPDYSDVDLLAIFPRQMLKWGNGWISSDTFISNIRNDLDVHFYAMDVRRDT